MSTIVKTDYRKFLPLIIGASIIIPGLVAFLFFSPRVEVQSKVLDYLPAFNAVINGITAMMLLMGLMAIKNGIVFMHRRFMTAAIALSVVFLLSYVTYHATHDSTKFGGEGAIRIVYYSILLTHILLAIVVVPLVLITYVRALAERFDKHKKLARITWPIWFYVAVTGVIVYLMISPYYPSGVNLLE